MQGEPETDLFGKCLIDRVAIQFYTRFADCLEKDIVIFLREEGMTVIRGNQYLLPSSIRVDPEKGETYPLSLEGPEAVGLPLGKIRCLSNSSSCFVITDFVIYSYEYL